MVTEATKRVIAIIVSFGGSESLQRWGQQMTELLQKYASAKNIQVEILS
jgi:protein subunit release factor B